MDVLTIVCCWNYSPTKGSAQWLLKSKNRQNEGDDNMKATTAQVIADGQKYVMNTYGRLPIVIDRGEGCYVWDLDGNKYLDLVAGIAVNSLGHGHPAVTQAIKEQSEQLLHCSNLYWIENQVNLAKLLVEKSDLGKIIERLDRIETKFMKGQANATSYNATTFDGTTSKPSSKSSSIVQDLPTIKFVINFTPIDSSELISF